MTNLKRQKLWLAGLLACLFSAAVGVPAGAAAPSPSPSPAQSRQAQIDQEKAALKSKITEADRQAKAYSQQIAESDKKRASLEKQISGLGGKLQSAEQRLAQAEIELEAARNDLFSVEQNLEVLESRLDLLRSKLESRSRTAYKLGGFGIYLEMLLGADNFRDFASRASFLGKVMADDRSRLTSVEQLAERLRQSRQEAEGRREEVTTKATTIRDEKKNIANLQNDVKASRAKAVGEIGVRKTLLGQVEKEKAVYLAQMRKLEAESRSIATLLKAKQKGQVFQAGSGTKLAWPTTGSVSSTFGYRTHPIFGDRRFHAGIDIAAPSGQAVSAADAGKVVFAGSQSGYGNSVVIDHGNAVATLYAHLSSITVANGTSVARGARVGAVGCTGYCTGPHLHFEVRVNGEPRDPMGFF